MGILWVGKSQNLLQFFPREVFDPRADNRQGRLDLGAEACADLHLPCLDTDQADGGQGQPELAGQAQGLGHAPTVGGGGIRCKGEQLLGADSVNGPNFGAALDRIHQQDGIRPLEQIQQTHARQFSNLHLDLGPAGRFVEFSLPSADGFQPHGVIAAKALTDADDC